MKIGGIRNNITANQVGKIFAFQKLMADQTGPIKLKRIIGNK